MTSIRFVAAVAGAVALATIGTPAMTDSDDELLEKVKVMEQECEAARAERLAPIRKKLAEECMQERGDMPDAEQVCTIETSTYGNNAVNAAGAVMQGMFYDLPECIAAEQAWQEWKDARPWR